MRIQENPVSAETLIRRAGAARDAASTRLPGVHVSDITSCSRKAWLTRHGGTATLDPDTILLFLMGEGHHTLLQAVSRASFPGYSANVEVPIKYLSDDVVIHGTVDLIESDPEAQDRPGEIKTTRASSQKHPEQFPHYLEQLLSYAVVLDQTDARLYIVHLMGNYRDHRIPILKAWDIQFSPDELARWAEEMERRYHLVTGTTIPPVYEAYDWECTYCPFGQKTGTGACPGGGLRQPFLSIDNPPLWLLTTAGIERA